MSNSSMIKIHQRGSIEAFFFRVIQRGMREVQIFIFWSRLQPSEDTENQGMQTYMKSRDGVVAVICMREKPCLKRCLKAEVLAPMSLLSVDLVGSPDTFMDSNYSKPYDDFVQDWNASK